MSAKDNTIDLLFETSWEVCNKVGGIYTVLSTKANTLHSLFGDKVIFIGPDFTDRTDSNKEFTESPRLLSGWRKNNTLPDNISVRVGRWEIPGRPIAILVDFEKLYASNNEMFGEMWNHFGVDSLHAYGDYDEACAFSHAAAFVIADIVRYKKLDVIAADGTPKYNVIAHFDEWTTGMGLLLTHKNIPSVATVFTTHATSIGRSICSNGKELYRWFNNYDGDIMARELNMQSKHSLEKTAAHNADAFTTVSEITAEECTQLLNHHSPIVTPNGFEAGFVPIGEEYDLRRKKARKKMLEIAKALTGKDYPSDTFIFATSGRCEFRNKGIDVFLESVKRFSPASGKKALAFVMVPSWQAGPRRDLIDAMAENNADCDKPLKMPVITHLLHNADSDAILQKIFNLGFNNNINNDVDVIFVPCYLNGNDGIFNMTYYDLLVGMDTTVFPSYYEPWGYTPLESVAFGVPTVTTSLSGFGRWILSNFNNSVISCGVKVVMRDDNNYEKVCSDISDTLTLMSANNEAARKHIAEAARRTAAAAQWSNFIVDYLRAYKSACANARKRFTTKKQITLI